MVELATDSTRSPSGIPSPDEWTTAVQVLRELLAKNNGCVSSRALRQTLEQRGVPDARALVLRLKFFDFDAPDEHMQKPGFHWQCHAKSFYSDERFAKLLQRQEAEAANAEQVAVVEEPEQEEEPAPPPEKRRNRQEEGRLGTYVLSALENIYQSDTGPDDASYVFDVHNDRAGTEFENVDLLAVHWRSHKTVELVAVEVKLDFTARLVQQARNYGRFADRVWVAVPVLAEASGAAAALREFDPYLFEHAVDIGLGILACRRQRGRSYEVLPIQWPRRVMPDPVEKEMFVERYRRCFEQAGVVAPKASHRYPNLA